jgi:hypothetical protein
MPAVQPAGYRAHRAETIMSDPAVKQIVLASRPKGLPTLDNFRLEEVHHVGSINDFNNLARQQHRVFNACSIRRNA